MRNTQIRQNKEIIIKQVLDVIICNMALGGSEKSIFCFQDTWTLTLKNVQTGDRGPYMCQVNFPRYDAWVTS